MTLINIKQSNRGTAY